MAIMDDNLFWGSTNQIINYAGGTSNSTYPWWRYRLDPPVPIANISFVDQFIEPNTEQKEGKHMRGLYEVFIVDYKKGVVVFETKLVADDPDKAKLKAAIAANIGDDLDDYDIIVRKIGDVRAKRKVQEVKVIEHD